MFSRNLLLSAFAIVAPALASNVLDLTPSNFDSVVFSGKPSLVEFYAPWCGHCKKLAPTYEELADSFAATGGVNIAKVDGDEHKSLGTKYGISGFPTIKWFDGKSKEPEDYTSKRDLESLQTWVTEKAGTKPKKVGKPPSEVKLYTDTDFNDAIGKDQGVFVAFTAPWCGHCKTLAPTWETLATDLVGDQAAVTIAKVDAEANKKIADAQGIKSFPTIKYFPAGSTEALDYSGGRDLPSLISYVNEQAGTHRMPGGGLDFSAGTVAALDKLVQGVSGSNLDEVLAKVQNSSKDLSDKAAEYYLKVLQKLKENTGYAEKESSRLETLLKKGGLSRKKEDDLTRRLNVLKKFVTGEASVEDVKQEL